ncbi:MAG: MFS transporter [Syntrophaceae bacterium]|nr:MFS transporter [Syntrophaceae bacterium]
MIIAVPFWMDLSASVFYLAAPLLVIHLGGNPIELGLIGTISASVHMILAHLTGRLSDRFGRRVLMVAGPLVFGISCLMATQVGSVKGVLALAALNGLSMAIFWPAFQAWIAEARNGAGLARNIGSFNMSWTASHLIGPTLSGLLFGLHSRLPFFLAAALCLSLFLVMWASVSERTPQPLPEKEPVPSEPEDFPEGRTFLYAIWIANFASFFILANARYQFPKLALDLTLSPSMIGLLMSCIGLAQFLGFFFLRGTERWHFNKHFLMGSQILAAVGLFFILFFNQTPIFASAFIMLGLCASLTYYSSLYYTVRLVKKKGKGTGLHESILGCGVVLGPLLGGVMAHSAGLRAPYVLCLGVLGLVIIIELSLIRRFRRLE